jgi:hypothetical protein
MQHMVSSCCPCEPAQGSEYGSNVFAWQVREEAEAIAVRCGADVRVSALAGDSAAVQRDILLRIGQLVVSTPGQVAQVCCWLLAFCCPCRPGHQLFVPCKVPKEPTCGDKGFACTRHTTCPIQARMPQPVLAARSPAADKS